MLVPGSNRRVFGVDAHVGVVVTGMSIESEDMIVHMHTLPFVSSLIDNITFCSIGLPADGRQIVNRARDEASSYKDTYGHPIVPSVLANRYHMF